ncbi:MAG: 2-iminoacetate synthase ThiH [Spirochaetia bacterium]|nr:2-iminoacetate synthase ThiH [Spirochaetia bacterium]
MKDETFLDLWSRRDFKETTRWLSSCTRDQVEDALSRPGRLSLDDFGALLSPAAAPYLEHMAVIAESLTRQRFGRTIQLYAPLYLSNECRSSCTYCGFSYGNQVKRRTLSIEEAAADADILYADGIRHILLLTGEDYARTPVSYIGQAAERLSRKFASVGIEVYPLKEDDYRMLRDSGVDTLAVYQETYDPERYREVHLRGMKKRLEYRLETPDRAGRAGVRKIAVGALLGLSDPMTDAFFTGFHAQYLMMRYWQTQISISLPRLRPAANVSHLPSLADTDYARFFFALRIFLPDAGLTLSTRESAELRDGLARICITQMSAGSKTEPGGYSGSDAAEQFEIQDNRSVAQVAGMIRSLNMEPVFVDWAAALK